MDARMSPAHHAGDKVALAAAADLEGYVVRNTSAGARPGLGLLVVRALAVRRLAERVAGHLGAPASDPETLAGWLMPITRRARDGAAIAGALTLRHGCAPDAEAAGLLDDLTYETVLAHDRLVAAWVAAHGVVPALACGDLVRVVTNDRDWRPVAVTGEIVGIDRAHARYHVFSPALGHREDGPGPAWRAIPYEDVQVIDAPAMRDAA